jgi:hypothetical protein
MDRVVKFFFRGFVKKIHWSGSGGSQNYGSGSGSVRWQFENVFGELAKLLICFSSRNFFCTVCSEVFLFLLYFSLFRFVLKQICLFHVFRNGSETPKQTETNRKKLLLVSRNKPKMNRNRLSFGLFRFEPKKKFVCFEDTLATWTFYPW